MNKKPQKIPKIPDVGYIPFVLVLAIVPVLSYYINFHTDNQFVAVSLFALVGLFCGLVFEDAIIASIVTMVYQIVFAYVFKFKITENIGFIIIFTLISCIAILATLWKKAISDFVVQSKSSRDMKMQLMRLNSVTQKYEESNRQHKDDSSKKIVSLSTRLVSLKQVARTLGSTLEVEAVVKSIMQACENVLKSKKASIYFIKNNTLTLKISSDPEEKPGKTVVMEENSGAALMELLKTNGMLTAKNIVNDPVMKGMYAQSGINFIMAAHLGTETESVGYLFIEEFETEDFEDNDVQILSILANLAFLSIRNAALYEKVKKLANQDGLTKLYTKRYFENFMDIELKRCVRYSKTSTVIMSDIDHFKTFNDTYGHQAGDYVLFQTAAIFRKMTRTTDLVARYGGEEFITVLPETDLKGAYILAERIRLTVEKTKINFEGKELNVKVSLGIASFPEHADNLKTLIKLCDDCLYHAKRTGRNKTVPYNSKIPSN